MTVTVKKRKFQQNEDANDVQKCFSCGTELKDHKSDHDYRVLEMLDFPIFESSWGADEELLLVEGLELHGVGNWEQISDHIGTKNKIECADHYDRVYVQSDVFPSPNPNLKSDFSTLQRARPAGYTKAQLPPPSRPLSSAPANHEIAGFMPGRREFEHEFDNDAEQQVKDLEFTEDDTPEEIGIIQSQEKRRPKEEKELYHKMRVFAKLMTESDFQVFMDGLLAELRLRMRIAHLQEYRRMGITTHRDAAEFEKERAIRTTNKAAGLTGFTIERSASRRHKLDEIFSLSLTSTSPNAHTNSGTHSSQPFFRNLNSAAGNSGSSSTIPTTPSYSTRTPSTSLTPAPLGGRKPANPLDVTNTDGVELLTEKECQLCSSLRLFPRAYLAIKDIIIKENLAHGFIKRRHVRSLVKIDVNKTSKIFDFFLEMGWITNVS
ncbi:hypothetical protein BDEG_26089 [Batrachochytrium dendrobatidis JEL423]|uniref:Transcriptional adapter 2 n=1 Tax=Batrachochytrium dendrobatidis (strain JEL423) TaxID=403673 RepID=A0A177WRE9_BATDL|nr:hypothetical protein BDEG_26089 [Batrachochytrium dendrobatidis JEL423]